MIKLNNKGQSLFLFVIFIPIFIILGAFVIDIGIDHKNILISEPKDVERMADNIEEVLHNPALCREMRKNAFDLVHTLNWNKSADELERYLTQG